MLKHGSSREWKRNYNMKYSSVDLFGILYSNSCVISSYTILSLREVFYTMHPPHPKILTGGCFLDLIYQQEKSAIKRLILFFPLSNFGCWGEFVGELSWQETFENITPPPPFNFSMAARVTRGQNRFHIITRGQNRFHIITRGQNRFHITGRNYGTS